MLTIKSIGIALAVVGTLIVTGPASATPFAGYYDVTVYSEGETMNSTSCVAIDPYDCGSWRLSFWGNTNDPLSFQYNFTLLSSANLDPNDLAIVCPRFWCGGDAGDPDLNEFFDPAYGTRTADASFDFPSRALYIKVRFESFPVDTTAFGAWETELYVDPSGGYFENAQYFCDLQNSPVCSGADEYGGAGFTVDEFRRTRIPEPATLALLGAGLVGFAAARRRRKAHIAD